MGIFQFVFGAIFNYLNIFLLKRLVLLLHKALAANVTFHKSATKIFIKHLNRCGNFPQQSKNISEHICESKGTKSLTSNLKRFRRFYGAFPKLLIQFRNVLLLNPPQVTLLQQYIAKVQTSRAKLVLISSQVLFKFENESMFGQIFPLQVLKMSKEVERCNFIANFQPYFPGGPKILGMYILPDVHVFEVFYLAVNRSLFASVKMSEGGSLFASFHVPIKF